MNTRTNADAAPTYKRKLRVGIATSGRFHLLDLARELDSLGIEVHFYSFVSLKRAQAFGLPRNCHVALLPFLFPLVAMERLFPRWLPRSIERAISWTLDLLVILRMRPCDVFICMSGMYVRAPRRARERFGARIIVHRGSRHILSQTEILGELSQAQKVTHFMIQRELESYKVADRIAVPSKQVVESFAGWPEEATKLFLNPYGVKLEDFPLRPLPPTSEPTLLFVGHWSYRKGVDLLAAVVESLVGVQLIHVGSIVDVAFPDHPRFLHHDPVPQWKLREFYQQAHVFVLASREEGLALVQCQAVASGLRLVCSDRTGGADLAELAGIARLIHVVPVGDFDALRNSVLRALDDVRGQSGVPGITTAEREALSWKAYALRHLEAWSDM